MSIFTLQNSIYFAQPYVDYAPLNAGFGWEPATSNATMIRNTLLAAPMSWVWNRNEITFTTTAGTQDYTQSFSSNGNDFGYMEKVALTDDQGNIWEIKDVYNNAPLAVSKSPGRPSAVSALTVSYAGSTQSVKFRFLAVPDEAYTVTVTYQKLAPLFGPFSISAVGNASAGNTIYTGIFDPYSLPTGATVIITGFVSPYTANNGTYTVGSCTSTMLTVNNASGTAVSSGFTAFVLNPSWSPIPDQYSDIYNNLFLSEVFAAEDDAKAQIYRQRGIAAFLSKASGLTETQRNIFIQQWQQRGLERQSSAQMTQQGNAGRGV